MHGHDKVLWTILHSLIDGAAKDSLSSSGSRPNALICSCPCSEKNYRPCRIVELQIAAACIVESKDCLFVGFGYIVVVSIQLSPYTSVSILPLKKSIFGLGIVIWLCDRLQFHEGIRSLSASDDP